MPKKRGNKVKVNYASAGIELYITGAREFFLPNNNSHNWDKSVNCICVAWLPYEDPLEIFSFQQGIRWDPVLGRRCTGVAIARSCTTEGKISALECDFTTSIHILNVGDVKYVANTPVSTDDNNKYETPSVNDAIELRVKFPHDLFSVTSQSSNFEQDNEESMKIPEYFDEPLPIFISLGYISSVSGDCVFRSATKWRCPLNAIGEEPYNLISGSPISWIGSAILFKKDWLKTSTLRRTFPFVLYPHQKLMDIVYKHRSKILHPYLTQRDTNEQYNYQLQSLQAIIESSITKWRNEDKEGVGKILLKSKTFVSYPLNCTGALRPLVENFNRKDLENSFFLASLTCIDILSIYDIPSWSDMQVWDFYHSKIHVCAIWKHERDILLNSSNPFDLFPYRFVEINGPPSNQSFSSDETVRSSDVRFTCYFSGRIFMTPIPGSEPDLYLFMLINRRPFATLSEPIKLSRQDNCRFGKEQHCKLKRISFENLNNDSDKDSISRDNELNNKCAGSLVCKLYSWPHNSKYLDKKQYAYLNLRPQKGIVYNLLYDYKTNMPDLYSAPTLGPYGVWTGFIPNQDKSLGKQEDNEKGLFGEAVYKVKVEEEYSNLKNDIDSTTLEIESQVDYSSDDLSSKISDIIEYDDNDEIYSNKPFVSYMCTATGNGIEMGIAGEWLQFIVQCRDEKGDKVLKGNGKLFLRLKSIGFLSYSFTAEPLGFKSHNRSEIKRTKALVSVEGSSICHFNLDELDIPIEWNATESYFGIYNCRYRCEKSGRYLLEVLLDGLEIAGSPFSIIITPSNPIAKACSTIGEGTITCRACPSIDYITNINRLKESNGVIPKYINSFIVVLRDEYGNRINSGGYNVRARCNSPMGIIHAIYDNWDGSYTIYYTVHVDKSIQDLDLKVISTIEKSNNSYISTRGEGLTSTMRAIKQAIGDNQVVKNDRINFNGNDINWSKLGFLGNDLQHISEKFSESTNFGSYETDFVSVPSISLLSDFEIYVYLDDTTIYGVPFTPSLTNLLELREWYDMVDSVSKDSTEKKIEKLLELNEFDKAIELMHNLEKKYLHNIKEIIQEIEREPNEHERLMDKVVSQQNEWAKLQNHKVQLEMIVKDNSDRERLLITFAKYLLKRLEAQMIKRQQVDSDMFAYRVLKGNNLEPLCRNLEIEYNKFQQQRTRELLRLVTLLESSKINSLEELMELYQLIADELRSLGRGNLATQFDLVNSCLIEEQQLKTIRSSLQHKSNLLHSMENIITEREKALKDISKNFTSTLELEKHDRNSKNYIEENKIFMDTVNIKPGKSIQTDDTLSLTDTIIGPLIEERSLLKRNINQKNNKVLNSFSLKSEHRNLGKQSDYVENIIKHYWKPLMEWDLKCFVKILKQCPRIAICLRELFCYFANTMWLNKNTPSHSMSNIENPDKVYMGDNNSITNVNVGAQGMNNSSFGIRSRGMGGIEMNLLDNNYSKSNYKWNVEIPIVNSNDPKKFKYRKVIGVTRHGFRRLVYSLDICKEFLESEKILRKLFEKYSCERPTSNIYSSKQRVRVIPQELWIPLLRELAYINALIRYDILRKKTLGDDAVLRLTKVIDDETGKIDYNVWENTPGSPITGKSTSKVITSKFMNLSLGSSVSNLNLGMGMPKKVANKNTSGLAVTQDNIRDLNRVTAFRHFCELHLIPLYRNIFGEHDFTILTMLPPINNYLRSEISLKNSSNNNTDNKPQNVGKGLSAAQQLYDRYECTIENCLKIVTSQLKVADIIDIFLDIAMKSMRTHEFDITRDMVQMMRNKDKKCDDILINYGVTLHDYIKPLHLYQYLCNIGFIPGHITGSDLFNIIDNILDKKESFTPVPLPSTYCVSKYLSLLGFIEAFSVCISKGIVDKLAGSKWSEHDIKTEVIEHLILYKLQE
ncbi:filamin/abp280 repeat family protein [Cryptosporidium muris RN66]|uniref:Filamin/abp280 repeat family protein n=1 Tax=Cryptosporidium muris (strain RN66) TaxID=441375 RepID=B6AHE3_CRYMR|nr:filamin/abp280 repeat family protein [Cryptosporidium muris RN66]EEA07638.1 filamin/abp280 repeat family protein [Cryptosporidium muris RN66]|eukprot:XP_002141987.1 filamin/abp280 repeat family protein [Cryptosporidium muris RN66]